jgi:hypothetical protein
MEIHRKFHLLFTQANNILAYSGGFREQLSTALIRLQRHAAGETRQ